jgi:large subunit ribosomal protein L4
MSKVKVLNLNGEEVKDLTLTDSVWNIEVNENVMFDAVNVARSSARQGTSSTKTRSEVRGGGRKPYKQKGTGNARQGSTRSPQWPGGGIVFGPKPRSFSKKQNRKERKLALRSALSSKYQDKELIVVDAFSLSTPKTSDFVKTLTNLKVNGKCLIVYSDENNNLEYATRNNNKVTVLGPTNINVLDLVANNYLMIDENSIKKLEEVLK